MSIFDYRIRMVSNKTSRHVFSNTAYSVDKSACLSDVYAQIIIANKFRCHLLCSCYCRRRTD